MTENPGLDAPLSGNNTVLVVDDVAVVRKAAFRLLSEAGHRVFEAASAAEALEVLETARPPVHLVIIDVMLPEINGVDLARLIRDRQPTLPVLFMSAYPAEVLVREGLDHPNVRFLAKPFTRDELMDKVQTTLRPAPRRTDQQSGIRRPPR